MSSINSSSGKPAVVEGKPAGASQAPVYEPGDGRAVVSTIVAGHGRRKPVKNLRVTLWGVQGSCPLFPEPHEVEDYKHRVCLYAISRIVQDMKEHTSSDGTVRLEELLGGPPNAANIQAYQEKLGSPDLPVYGGETTCISVETGDGHTVLIDGGSGIRNCSKYLIPAWGDRPRNIHIFGTHEHLDHRSGLPFCQFCFTRPPFTLNVYGTQQFLNALDSRYGVFSHKISDQMHFDDPVDYRIMSASFKGTELRSFDENDKPVGDDTDPPWQIHDMRQPIIIGKTKITAFDVYHGTTRCLSYKFQHEDATFLFSTDHELRHGDNAEDPRQIKSMTAEARLREHSQGVDVAYYDGQYFRDEYDGRKKIGSTSAVPRMDWGHGCVEDIIERAKQCEVKKTFIGHHDPERSWPERLSIDQNLLEQSLMSDIQVELAKSELVLDL